MKAIHYGWVIVGVGVLVKMTGLGFGRFSYPMLLPNMRFSLGFNYAEMGLLSGAIMMGYLLFSLIGGVLATLDPRHRPVPGNHFGWIFEGFNGFLSINPSRLADWFCPLHRADARQQKRVKKFPHPFPIT
jgi:hypothetical protein